MFDWSNRVIGFQDPDYATSAAFDPALGTDMARAALALRPAPDEQRADAGPALASGDAGPLRLRAPAGRAEAACTPATT